ACYLIEFAGRVHRRERLADLFWTGADANRARPALNTAIWRIRKMLDLGSKGTGRHLVTVGEDVVLQECQAIQVDTHQLESASKLILNTPDGAHSASGIQAASAAIDAYAGPFLEGYEGDWVLQERERLHCLFVRSTFCLMRANAMKSNYEDALEYGRRILAIDALRESVQRDVMLLLVLNGQRAEALRAYERFATLLKADLDIAPMPETQRLYREIQSGSIFGCSASDHTMHFGVQR